MVERHGLVIFLLHQQEVYIPKRYLPGHRLTPGEAQALNTLRADNIRRNRAKYWSGLSRAELQAAVLEYDASYDFSHNPKSQGGISPVEMKAWELARDGAAARGRGEDQDFIRELAQSEHILRAAEAICTAAQSATASAVREMLGEPEV